MKLKQVIRLDDILTEQAEIMIEQGEDTSLDSIEASTNIIKAKAISDLILSD